MLKIKEIIRPQSLEEAYELNQKRTNRILGGMLWMRMSNIQIQKAIDLSGLGLNEVEETEEELAGQEVLSSREKEIITCVVKGMTNKEIADALYLSAHTVITHRRNIARKLQIHSPAGLTIYAIVNKLVTLNDVKDL